jgi:hypothetical protein
MFDFLDTPGVWFGWRGAAMVFLHFYYIVEFGLLAGISFGDTLRDRHIFCDIVNDFLISLGPWGWFASD